MPYIGNIVQDFSVNNAMLNIDSVTSIKVLDGTIVNADINDSAAIAMSKLALSITNSEVNASAAIAMSKLALSITNSEVNASAAIAGSKISPDFGSQNIVTTGVINSGAITTTGNVNVSNSDPSIVFSDSDNNPDFDIKAGGGRFSIRDSTNNAERLKIDSSGRVLIGTTTTDNAFSGGDSLIIGTTSDRSGITLVSSTSNDGGLYFSKGTSTNSDNVKGQVVYQHDSNGGYFRFYTNAAERMRLDSSGLLLLGTTTAGEGTADDFTIATAGHTGITIRSGASSEGNIFFADGTSGNARFRGMVRYFHDSDALAFNTSATERMRIDSSGRLLVGTATASTAGNSQYSLFEVSGNTSGATSAGHLSIKRGEAVASLSNGDTLGRLIFSGSDGGDFAYIQAAVDAAPGSNDYPGRLMVFTGNDGSGSPSEKLRIDSSGRVGIGTSSPDTRLTVATSSGDAFIRATGGTNQGLLLNKSDGTLIGGFASGGTVGGSANDVSVRVESGNNITFAHATTERMRIDSLGRVLMGTTSPIMNEAGFNEIVIGGKSEGAAITLQDDNSNVRGGLFTSDANLAMIIRTVTNHPLEFRTNNTQRAQIDTNGKLMVGGTTADAKFTVIDSSTPDIGMRYNGTSGGHNTRLMFMDKRGVINAQVANNLQNDGVGTAAAHLEFATATGGTLSTRMRILNSGLVAIGDAMSGMDMGFGQQVLSSKSSTHSAAIFGATSDSLTTSIIYNSNTSFGSSVSMCDWRAAASNSSAFYFLRCSTSSASDNEFFLAGDGNAYADGNWNSGGADYAEYFEWSDGNASDEDRRGMTVVLDGTKIKIATSSDSTDNIIGVVSGNPAMVADTAYCKWSGKYQRDDYNAYVRDSEGHRVLNSDYDDTKTYLPRKERKEWDAIGMVGKLRIRKGQITGTRWIKMKDISDSVEEWLVR